MKSFVIFYSARTTDDLARGGIEAARKFEDADIVALVSDDSSQIIRGHQALAQSSGPNAMADVRMSVVIL